MSNCGAPSLSTTNSGDTPRSIRPPSKAPSVTRRTYRSQRMANSSRRTCQASSPTNCWGPWLSFWITAADKQLLVFPVGQGCFVDHVHTVRAVQHLQEVQPALAVGALEAGKQVVADHGAITIASLMAGPRIVGADVRRRCQPRRTHLVLLLVEDLLVLGQNAAELSLGNIDAKIMQLLQQQRLRYISVVMLVQDIADQVGAKVTAGQPVGR